MRLISIDSRPDSRRVIINTDQIVAIEMSGGNVIVNLSNGHGVTTMFTDVDHAVDYIQRAATCSFDCRK